MSSLGTANYGTVYETATADALPVERPRGADPRLAITVSSVIAAFLAMLGTASILAGLAGVVGIEPLGLIRTASYLGLGFAGAGSGGLLLIVLGDLRKGYEAGSSAGATSV